MLNTDIWEVVQPTNSTISFVSDGASGYYLNINYDSSPTYNFAGLVSKTKIPVGTKVVARVRRLTGDSRATFLGFGNYNPAEPRGLYDSAIYLKIDNKTNLDTDFDLRDESGSVINSELSVSNPTAF